MVKLGPDLYDGSDSYSGYDADGNFTGFSMLHESGTGGAPKYGVVSQMPVLGGVRNPLADHNDTRARPDQAEVGYYQSFLGSGITVELAGAERAGFYQYTFPDDDDDDDNTTDKVKNVIVDVSHVLSSYRGQGLQQAYLGGNMEVINGYSEDGYYQGYGSYNNVSGESRRPRQTWTTSNTQITHIQVARAGTEPPSGQYTFAATLTRPQRRTPRSSARATPTISWSRTRPGTA